MLVFPNYKKCSVNVISSIKKYYRIPTNVPSIEKLDDELNRMYKNVVLIVLCGVGENMLRASLKPSDILLKKMTEQLTSVCPSYPAAAEVSSVSGLYPNEHGRLGQTMFFKEFCRTVELSSNLDPYSNQPVSVANAADFILPYENIFGEIAGSILGSVQPFSIALPGVKIAENKSYHKVADNPKRMFELIKKIAETDQNTFTYVQWNAPQESAIRYGCESEETKSIIRDINDTVNGLSKSMKDTLIIVTSTHGMKDISSEIMLNLKYELCDCLLMPPVFGGRAVNFYVKADCRSDFERLFARDLSEDFHLMSRSDILKRELFGCGKTNKKIYDFIGDYCAFAMGDKSLTFRALNQKHRSPDKAGSGGITSDEMCLPLCVITTKQTSGWKRPLTENIAPRSFN
ncbi:MAG: alkaline phosphatase family protein [Oscillospiraceae bacterium]|nr:alkaline phosphatase family protein [Oscillospiraceae bacterium]